MEQIKEAELVTVCDQTTVRISKEMKNELKTLCELTGLTERYFVDRAVKQFLVDVKCYAAGIS